MQGVISSTTSLHESLVSSGVSLPNVTDALSVLYEDIVRELEEMFPPPSEALGHDERQAMWDHAMTTLGDATIGLLVDTFHLPAKETREHWNAISAAIGSVLITVADLAVQHPQIVKIAVGVLLMELVAPLIIRPLLQLVGFGALGPVKGSFAAWAQSVFWGGKVEANSVFAVLQKAGMVL
ncbi:hypothetical protein CPB85DRAFT_84815 [Mucidula mucida]|nr:hypothetical protein CPB85DRAFT_84815 [Mucidula mucida]